MVSVAAIVVMLFGHWVFDFVFQPNWMGLRKSKEWGVLSNHAARITVGCAVTGLVIALAFHGHPAGALAWAAINGVGHFAIDGVTSRITGSYWKQERIHAFFVTIGFDQFLHMALAVTTLAWLVL